MRYLLFHSIYLLLLLASCSLSLTKGLQKEGKVMVSKERLAPMPDASEKVRKYNMTIDFRDKHFSGLLLIKEMEKNTYRTLFGTHFGLSIFDFELTPDSFIVHNCIEPLKKKNILKLLHKDFAVLLSLYLEENTSATLYKQKDGLGTSLVYCLKNENMKACYSIDYLLSQVQRIETGKGLWKTSFSIDKNKENDPIKSIKINHPFLKLYIGLEELE